MRLEDNYYKLTDVQAEGTKGTFSISLLAGCDVYRGHFPGNPVCPGVCNIQTIRELASRLAGKELRIAGIRRCRFMSIMTPANCPKLSVNIDLTPTVGGYAVTATIGDDQHTYIDYKGEMTA